MTRAEHASAFRPVSGRPRRGAAPCVLRPQADRPWCRRDQLVVRCRSLGPDEAIGRIVADPHLAGRRPPYPHDRPVVGRRDVNHRLVLADPVMHPVRLGHQDLPPPQHLRDHADMAVRQPAGAAEHQDAADRGSIGLRVAVAGLPPPVGRRAPQPAPRSVPGADGAHSTRTWPPT